MDNKKCLKNSINIFYKKKKDYVFLNKKDKCAVLMPF